MFDLDYTQLLPFLFLMVFLTNVIVEVIKKVFSTQGNTNNLIALITSLAVVVLAMVVYTSYKHIPLQFTYFILSIVVGFIVALISMVGWDKVLKMWFESQGGGNIENKEKLIKR